ncbi:hypothetical protein [Burkholderia sp. Bp8998]|uniref:hypothetical protein n=1 Tax=Burkholderia sp. Bp8998 TaxID=2184557 RepID=UPI00163AAADA|nr:hypothetical protein [Burkholderia sp. Bp8998]
MPRPVEFDEWNGHASWQGAAVTSAHLLEMDAILSGRIDGWPTHVILDTYRNRRLPR